MRRRVVRGTALLAAAFYTLFGAWALLAPRSFFETVAPFPPYNEHFLHDAGAFQLGLGAALLAALARRSALVAALAGAAVASVLHAGAHAVDGHLGGRPTDPWVLGLLAALVVAALVLAWRAEAAASPR
jgi:peptidoglycan/LPS O-acetylase OafA/YrhL